MMSEESPKNIQSRTGLLLLIINLLGLTSIFDPIFDTCVTCRRKPFLRHTTDGTICQSGGNEQHLVGMDEDPVPGCLC